MTLTGNNFRGQGFKASNKHATVGQNNLVMMYLVTLLETSAECCMFSHEGRSEPGCSWSHIAWLLREWLRCDSSFHTWSKFFCLVPNSGTVFCTRIHQSLHKVSQLVLRLSVFCKDSKCGINKGALERRDFSDACFTTGPVPAVRQVFVMLPYFTGTGHFVIHLL